MKKYSVEIMFKALIYMYIHVCVLLENTAET